MRTVTGAVCVETAYAVWHDICTTINNKKAGCQRSQRDTHGACPEKIRKRKGFYGETCDSRSVPAVTLEGQKFGNDARFPMGNPYAVIFMPPEEGSFKTWDMRRAAVISSDSVSCGSGACAAATAAILDGRTKRKVNVEMLGGMLEVEWKTTERCISPEVVILSVRAIILVFSRKQGRSTKLYYAF